MDTRLDKMVSNLSSNVKKEVAKYIHMCNKKNDDALNQLPLVKSLRRQLAKYQHNYGDEIETLRNRVVILEAKHKAQAFLCNSRAGGERGGGGCNLQWAPRCSMRKTFAREDDQGVRGEESLLSYEDAKKRVSEMTNKEKKIWLQWAALVLPENIPPNPEMVYQGNGWVNWQDFLGLRDNRVSLTVTEMDNNEGGASEKDIKKVTIDTTKILLSTQAEKYLQQNVKEEDEEDEDEEDEDEEDEEDEEEEEGDGDELDEACWNNGVFMGLRGAVSSEIADCDPGPSGDEGSVSAIAELLPSAPPKEKEAAAAEASSAEEESEAEAETGEEDGGEEDGGEEDGEEEESEAEAETGEEDDDDEEEELEVDEWKYKGAQYYITDRANGRIFEYLEGGDIGEEIGYLKKSKVFFS